MEAVTEEMQETLVKTAHSPLICEARDATSALHDRRGRTAAQASAMPIHLGVLAELGLRFAAKYPEGVAEPGDLYITNDPYAGGTHMPDIAVAAPVFSGPQLVGYVSTMAHHRDIGGLLPASVSVAARDIHAEGLRLPIIRLAKSGQINPSILSMIEVCSRTPKSMRGDLGAQIAACKTGSLRFSELFERWPVDTVYESITALMDYSERMTRAEISTVPDGQYQFSDKLDDNALDPDSGPVTIAVTMTVAGDELLFDFAGSDPQVESAINNVLASTASVVYYGVRTLTGDRIPNNDGCFRPITVTAPEGCVVNASYPAPVASRGIALMRIEDVVVGVLGKALPQRMTAAHSGQYTMVSVAGTHPDSGEPMIGQLSGPVVGGHGARPTKDGIDVSSHGCTNGTIDAMELGESRYPMRFNQMALWPDSGGAGRNRGGLGWFAEVEWTHGDSMITFRRERTRFQPWGLAGGGSAPLCRTEYEDADGKVVALPAKVVIPFSTGEKLRYWTTGSGGYGNAYQRAPEKVLEDVLNGRVTVASARADYGVAIRDSQIDQAATGRLRDGS
nr:putative D-/L-hydantoinase subunit B [Nerophis lumbriciformis]